MHDLDKGVSVTIPRSFNYESKEYIVTSILEGAFSRSRIKSIDFESDSGLQIIYKGAFAYSFIETIGLPSSCIGL